MKLEFSQHFPCTPERLWAIFLDPAFDARVKAVSGVDRQVIERREEADGTLYIRRRVVTDRRIPRPLQKALDGTEFVTYEQHGVIDFSKNTLTWRIVPPTAPDRIKAEGITHLTPTPDGGCDRRVVGEVEIRIPLLGKRMERALVQGIEQSYAKVGEVVRQWLDELEADRTHTS